jgi:hypothetical protein
MLVAGAGDAVDEAAARERHVAHPADLAAIASAKGDLGQLSVSESDNGPSTETLWDRFGLAHATGSALRARLWATTFRAFTRVAGERLSGASPISDPARTSTFWSANEPRGPARQCHTGLRRRVWRKAGHGRQFSVCSETTH